MTTIEKDTTAEAVPYFDKLPELCFSFDSLQKPGERIIAIRRGERGFYATALDAPDLTVDAAKAIVDAYNERLGVTWAQKQAMLFGSLFGFDVPGADPDRHAAREPKLATAKLAAAAADAKRAPAVLMPARQTVQ